MRVGGQGLQGQRSKLFFEVPRIIQLLKSEFQVPVRFFVENVFSMDQNNRAAFSLALGCQPWLIDAKWFTWCRRPRLWWCSWAPKLDSNETMLDHGDYREWVFPLVRGPSSTWLDENCFWNGAENEWLPTITRPKTRRNPPPKPAGLERASSAAVNRWKADSYRLQVYNYETKVMVQDHNGLLRLPSLTERETLMGFDAGYVSGALSLKLGSSEKFDLGGQMIGNSFCVHVVVMLCHSLLVHLKHYTPRNHKALVQSMAVAPPDWLLYPRFQDSATDTFEAARLVSHFSRYAERGGTDVRLDVGVPFRAKAWPRAGINSSLFHWAIVHGYPWKSEAHINVLELQATLNAIKWRLRKAQNLKMSVLHLIDNQAVCAIVAKGRSSAYRLKHGLKKLNALVLASGLVLAVGYVATDANPSDIPSRWSARSMLLKSKRVKKKGKAVPCKRR